MDKILNDIFIQCGLVIPLDKEETEMLAHACNEFVSSEDFSFSDYEEMLGYYINNDNFTDLDLFIENYANNNDWGGYKLPNRIKNALVFYCVYLCIINCDDIREKGLRSLSLQNAMIQVHGKWENIKFQNILSNLYFKCDDYTDDKSIGEKLYPEEFVQSVFSEGYMINETITEDIADNIHSLALIAWDAEVKRFISELKENDPFVRVYLILKYYFINKPQILTKKDFEFLMSNVFPRGGKGQKQNVEKALQKIADLSKMRENIKSENSILLSEINNARESELAHCLKNIQLTPKEFFVYLYHELLLEDLLR